MGARGSGGGSVACAYLLSKVLYIWSTKPPTTPTATCNMVKNTQKDKCRKVAARAEPMEEEWKVEGCGRDERKEMWSQPGTKEGTESERRGGLLYLVLYCMAVTETGMRFHQDGAERSCFQCLAAGSWLDDGAFGSDSCASD